MQIISFCSIIDADAELVLCQEAMLIEGVTALYIDTHAFQFFLASKRHDRTKTDNQTETVRLENSACTQIIVAKSLKLPDIAFARITK
jgi:hypothetical protein